MRATNLAPLTFNSTGGDAIKARPISWSITWVSPNTSMSADTLQCGYMKSSALVSNPAHRMTFRAMAKLASVISRPFLRPPRFVGFVGQYAPLINFPRIWSFRAASACSEAVARRHSIGSELLGRNNVRVSQVGSPTNTKPGHRPAFAFVGAREFDRECAQ